MRTREPGEKQALQPGTRTLDSSSCRGSLNCGFAAANHKKWPELPPKMARKPLRRSRSFGSCLSNNLRN
jgi:hypothetical protein